MKLKNLFIASVSAILLTSCAVTSPFKITNNEVGTKIGKSSTICLFSGGGTGRVATYNGAAGLYNGIMLNKNFGIVEAAKNGGISKIGAVDIKTTSYVFFVKREFIVAGE
jgi:hypothetical protein